MSPEMKVNIFEENQGKLLDISVKTRLSRDQIVNQLLAAVSAIEMEAVISFMSSIEQASRDKLDRPKGRVIRKISISQYRPR